MGYIGFDRSPAVGPLDHYKRGKIIEVLELVEKIRAVVEDKKAEDVVVLDVRGLSSITDYFVIATANNKPHLKALSDSVVSSLKKEGQKAYRSAGTPDSEWVAVDYVHVVAHFFSSETREYYALEELWSDAPQLASQSQ